MRLVFRAFVCVVSLVLLLPASAEAQIIRQAFGDNPAAIQATVDLFRMDLGVTRREINWDGVPDASAAPAAFPPDFFNTTSPRGAIFSTPGTGFQVSMDGDVPADADPDQILFTNLNAGYGAIFQTFSAERLFTPIGSNLTDVVFRVPGTNLPAYVSAFGAVFVDPNGTSSSLEFFDENDMPLGAALFAPTANSALAFLGVRWAGGELVTRVRIRTGVIVVGNPDLGDPVNDVVVLDDLIYSDPLELALVPAAPPGALLLLAAMLMAVAAVALERRARRRHA
jgi:hypothetical protein